MDWLNLHISTIDSPEATVCDPTRRATWIWLLRFCIGQENGGRIENCGAWGDTTWQQMAKVRLREVRAESTLWRWDGDSLIVHFYPAEKQDEVQAKREVARTNGRSGGRPKKTNVGTNVGYSSKPTLVESVKAEGNGMERKGMEGEGNGSAPTPAAAPEDVFSTPALPGPDDLRVKTLADLENQCPGTHIGRDERQTWERLLQGYGWEAMIEACGYSQDPKTNKIYLSAVKTYLAGHFELEAKP